jgi:iron(II)-dependent oxidoreductase
MKTSRLFLFACILILISLACKAPINSRFLADTTPPEDEGETTDTDISTSEDTERLVPHNTDGADVTYIPGATYQMGSLTTDELADEDELPQHQVTEDEFYIYTFEVTNQMYTACVDAGVCLVPKSLEDGPTSHYEHPDYAEYPVVGVDWVMARDYCTWAGARLPTEAEWELVSRGPDSLYYPWGEEEPTCDYVNMKGCYKPIDTQEVGYYLLGNSPYEVWDMSGNVWEWVHDWYTEDYYSISPEDNPIGPLEPADPDKPLRAVRGGGLNSDPDKMRSASRIGLNPYRTFIDVGIRCVVGEELLFPSGYDHGEDRHDDVPPDTADDGDDPDDDSGLRSIRLTAGCRTWEIVDFGVFFDPAEPALTAASTDYGPLVCDHLPPPEGTYLCYDLPGDPFELITLYFTFADGSEMIAAIEHPDCEAPLWIDHFCDPDETGAIIPYLRLHFPPGGPDFVGAAAEPPGGPAVDMDCTVTAPGLAVCHDLPGDVGDVLGIFAAFDDGSTLLSSYEHPLCLDAEGFLPPWDIVLSCIPHIDSAEYYASIDTNMPGWDFFPVSWTLSGVPEPKNCTLENPALNILGCTFPIGVYTDLEFCAEWVGGSGLHCETFAIGGMLPGDCTPPPDDDDGGDPVAGWCRPGVPPANCSGPCMLTCPTGVNCNPCTMP